MAAAAGKKLKDNVTQASSRKESAAEIADIFRSVKEKKKKNKRKEAANPSSNSNFKNKEEDDKKGNLRGNTANSNKKKKTEVKNKDDGFPTEKNKRRATNDGLTIYSAEELGFGKSEAGGTPLCPFDCSCCF